MSEHSEDSNQFNQLDEITESIIALAKRSKASSAMPSSTGSITPRRPRIPSRLGGLASGLGLFGGDLGQDLGPVLVVDGEAWKERKSFMLIQVNHKSSIKSI